MLFLCDSYVILMW